VHAARHDATRRSEFPSSLVVVVVVVVVADGGVVLPIDRRRRARLRSLSSASLFASRVYVAANGGVALLAMRLQFHAQLCVLSGLRSPSLSNDRSCNDRSLRIAIALPPTDNEAFLSFRKLGSFVG
jgi:hypothetical protein